MLINAQNNDAAHLVVAGVSCYCPEGAYRIVCDDVTDWSLSLRQRETKRQCGKVNIKSWFDVQEAPVDLIVFIHLSDHERWRACISAHLTSAGVPAGPEDFNHVSLCRGRQRAESASEARPVLNATHESSPMTPLSHQAARREGAT